MKVVQKLISSSYFDVNELSTDSRKKPRGLAAAPSSTLYQMAIPDGLESRTYGALFRFLSREGQVPLGLFRGVFPQMKVGSKNNKMSYVYTNPTKDTELFSCDRVFVLSPVSVLKTNLKVSPRILYLVCVAFYYRCK
jgi:hypothetical protein